MDSDFLIVGGGPAGATAGGLLAQAGHRVTICEHKKFPRHKVCGEFISAQALPVLDRLGLLERYNSAAGPEIRGFVAYVTDGATLSAAMPVCDGKFPRSISRDVLDAMLLERAAVLGARVLQPCHVTDVQGTAAEGFVVNATEHGAIAARCVILAHGLAQRGTMDGNSVAPPFQAVSNSPSGSSVPRGSNRRRGQQYLCFKCHLENCDIPEQAIVIGGAAGIYAGLVRTSDGIASARYTLAFAVRGTGILPVARLHGQDRAASVADSHLQYLLKCNRGFRAALAHAKRIGPWYASGPMVPGIRQIYHDGRFFVGNAAGEVHALVGEGITLAMRGAALLADCVQAIDPKLDNLDAVGHAYQRAWLKEFRGRYHAANLFANLTVRPGLASLAAGVLDAFPALLDYCVVRSGKWSDRALAV